MLIGMDFILEILETAIVSAQVKNTIPISVILIGPSGAGKSQALLQYSTKIPTIRRSDDLTTRGIEDFVLADKDNKTAHILCPDFNVVLSHRETVVNLTSAKLMTLMSDGICRVDDGRTQKELEHRQVGILTAMTSKVYIKVAKKWDMLGFKRRFLPIFFEYSTKTKTEVQGTIRNGKNRPYTEIKNNPLRKTSGDVQIKAAQAFAIETLSSQLAEFLSYHPAREKTSGKIISVPGERFLEFTPHHILRTMAKSHAWLRGRNIVTQKDIEFLSRMVDFCKFGSPEKI